MPVLLDYAGRKRGLRHNTKQTSLGLGYWDKLQEKHPWHIPKPAQKPLKITINRRWPVWEQTPAQTAKEGALTLEDLPAEILQYIIEEFLPSVMDQWSLGQTSQSLRAQVQEVYQRYSWSLLPTAYTPEGKIQRFRDADFFFPEDLRFSHKGTIRNWAQYEHFPTIFYRFNRKGEVVHEEELKLVVTCKNYGHKEHPISEVILTLSSEKYIRKYVRDTREIKLDGLFCNANITPLRIESAMGPDFLATVGFDGLKLFMRNILRAATFTFEMDRELASKIDGDAAYYYLEAIYKQHDLRIKTEPLFYEVVMAHIMEQAFGQMVRPDDASEPEAA